MTAPAARSATRCAPRHSALQRCKVRRPPRAPGAWPGADPSRGRSLYLDQLALWDAETLAPPATADGAPRFDPAGCVVRRLPRRNLVAVTSQFFARHHYTAGPGMRGLPFGLFRGEALLGIAVFSRVARPRWARENFRLLPEDSHWPAETRRHLTVTEAEYLTLSRFALTDDCPGGHVGRGAASWFLSRSLAGLEARNRALWAAHQALARGRMLRPDQLRLVREAAGADLGRGRGYTKAVASWSDPWEGHLGRVTQILGFHWCGRTNRGRWTKEAVGLRSGRRLSGRTLAKAGNPAQRGHVTAALRLAWEGGAVTIEETVAGRARRHSTEWVPAVADVGASEAELSRALAAAWGAWRRTHLADDAVVALRWERGTGVEMRRFPPKHAYLCGLGAPFYRDATELRHRSLTARLLAEEAGVPRRRRPGVRRRHYPRAIPLEELKPELRSGATPSRDPEGDR